MAVSAIETIKANVDNDKLSDSEFRTFIRNTMTLFPDDIDDKGNLNRGGFNKDSLKLHIQSVSPLLSSEIVEFVEDLPNMRNTNVNDVGLWLDERNHFTVIYTRFTDNFRYCSFQIASHGKKARELAANTFKQKYSDDMTLSELTEALRSIEVAACK